MSSIDLPAVLMHSEHAVGISLVARGIFVALLAVAVISDIRVRRIPNAVSTALAMVGLLATSLGFGASATVGGALLAFTVGLLLWLPGYAFGWVGAGDVKLFAAAATWLSPAGACWAALAGSLAGAIVGIVTYVWSHGLSFTALRLGSAIRQPQLLTEPIPSARGRDARVPYGVSLVAGVLLQAFAPNWHIWSR